jgi:hypothetical protein
MPAYTVTLLIYVHVVTRILKVNQPYGAHVRAVDLHCCSDEYKLNSRSFLLILFYYLWIISVASHCITSCSAIICLEVPSIFVSQLNFRDMGVLVSCEPSLTTLNYTIKRSGSTIATSQLKIGDKLAT